MWLNNNVCLWKLRKNQNTTPAVKIFERKNYKREKRSQSQANLTICSCISSANIVPPGHGRMHLHFQKGIQLFWKPLKQRISVMKDYLLLSNTGTPCLQKITWQFKNWLWRNVPQKTGSMSTVDNFFTKVDGLNLFWFPELIWCLTVLFSVAKTYSLHI